jgi:hypothetical protein
MTLEKVQSQASDRQATTGDMVAQCQQVVDEFVALQDNFEKMMKLTGTDNLASAMVKHRELMAQFADNLAKHHIACSQVAGVTDDKHSSGFEHSTHEH